MRRRTLVLFAGVILASAVGTVFLVGTGPKPAAPPERLPHLLRTRLELCALARQADHIVEASLSDIGGYETLMFSDHPAEPFTKVELRIHRVVRGDLGSGTRDVWVFGNVVEERSALGPLVHAYYLLRELDGRLVVLADGIVWKRSDGVLDNMNEGVRGGRWSDATLGTEIKRAECGGRQ